VGKGTTAYTYNAIYSSIFHHVRHVGFANGFQDKLVICVVRRIGACREAHNMKWLVQLIDLEFRKSVLEVDSLGK